MTEVGMQPREQGYKHCTRSRVKTRQTAQHHRAEKLNTQAMRHRHRPSPPPITAGQAAGHRGRPLCFPASPSSPSWRMENNNLKKDKVRPENLLLVLTNKRGASSSCAMMLGHSQRFRESLGSCWAPALSKLSVVSRITVKPLLG